MQEGLLPGAALRLADLQHDGQVAGAGGLVDGHGQHARLGGSIAPLQQPLPLNLVYIEGCHHAEAAGVAQAVLKRIEEGHPDGRAASTG